MNNLPESWCWTKLSTIVSFNPGIDKSKFSCDDEMPFVPMSAIEAGTGYIDTTERRPLSKVKTGFTSFSTGDVLFAKITPCMENGKMAIVPVLPNDVGFGTTELHVLRPSYAIDAKLLYYFVSSVSLRHEAQHKMTGAVGQKRVPKRYLETKEFPLPPLAEQHRIIEKMESLFIQLDKGEEELCKAHRLLSLYRQSILKKAFTGRLVFQDTDDELASELLTRIQKNCPHATTNTGGRMKEIKLPENWTIATLGSVVAHFESGKRPRGGVAKIKEGIISLGGEHLRPDGTISIKNAKFVPEKFAETLDRVRVKLNDILIVKDGATTGKTSLASSDFVDSVINEHLFQLRPVDGIESKFLFFFLWSSAGNDEIMKDFRGTAQGGITKSVLEVCDVPIAPINEQRRIVEKIEVLFAQVDKLEEEIGNAQRLIDLCRQSILKDAFTGRLVSQNSDDESASELLARIQKASSFTAKKTQSKAKKQTTHKR